MEKIIGRGVLLLDTLKGPYKFGYQLSSDGIHLSALGENTSLQTLSEIKKNTSNFPASIKGTGHLILNALPASPNDAFYNVSFEASKIGTNSESFTLQVTESEPFAHGPQSHFSNLNLTFQYKKGELSILTGGAISLHLNEGVFNNGEVLRLVPSWKKATETLVFTANKTTRIQMDSIGKLSKIEVEVGSSYDRWAQVQGLYTFEGVPGEFATHDISSQGAPSLYFDGKNDFKEKPNKPYGATWKDRGIAIDEKSILANLDNIPNPVVNSIRESEAFSIEIWIKPSEPLQEGPARIFSIEGKGNKNYFFLGQGPWNEGVHKEDPARPGAYLNVNFKYPQGAFPVPRPPDWEKPFKSPADSLSEVLTHVVYSCDQNGMQRIFINGVQVAQRFNSEYYNDWLFNPRIVVGNGFGKKKPWKGEIHQLAIFNRALTADEVRFHYCPAIKITGDFSLNHVIPPLEGKVFPFHLSISEKASALIADKEVNLEIKPRLGFRHIYLECKKMQDSPWFLSGRFQTWFWEDLVDLKAHLEDSSGNNEALLHLTSPGSQPTPITNPGLGVAKFKDVLLRIGNKKAWELSFGEHQEYNVIPLVLENSYWEFKLGAPQPEKRPQLVLAKESIKMEGKWLGEEMDFISEGVGVNRVLNGSTSFSIPFTLELPPKIDPKTGDILGETILLKDVEMRISLAVKLHKEGFLGILNANFDYENQIMTLPERRIYNAPVSKMALLGEILEEVKAQDENFFTRLRRHPEDYFLDLKTNGQPYTHLSASTTPDIKIESILPRIFATNPSPGFKSPRTKPVIELTQTATECKLTLNLKGVDSNGIRSAFDDLLKKVEDQNGLSSGGLRLLQSRIAERLPLEYNDLLYYYYGWDISKNYIDLHPGMRLRVDFQNYQFVHVTEQKAKNGFVGGGSIFVPIHSYTHDDGNGSQYLGFGPFLSRLQSSNRGNLTTNGAGGLYDLAKVGSRKKFFRLFFPNESISAAAPDRSVTIVGANRWQDLPTDIPLNVDNKGDQISFFFRDKAMIIPEIQVFVANSEVYVPIGTSVRQLIEKYANIPVALKAQPNLKAFLGKARPRRLIHSGDDSTPAYRFLNPVSSKVENNQDIFDLPLIKGDKFYF